MRPLVRWLAAFASTLLITCSVPDAPVDFQAGQFKCDHCQMNIADLRFRGEAITKKGKVYRFDSIECLAAWSSDNRESVHARWVGDFSRPGQWLALEKAHVLQSSGLRSPMGAGLSAFPGPTEAADAARRYGGRSISARELSDFVEVWRRDPGGALGRKHAGTGNPHRQPSDQGAKGHMHSTGAHP